MKFGTCSRRIVASLDLDRHRFCGELAERRGKVDGGAFHRALNRPRRRAGAHVAGEHPVGASRHPIQIGIGKLAPHRGQVHGSGAGDARAALGGRDRDLRRPAQGFQRDFACPDVALAERQHTADLGQRRDARHLQLVIGKRELSGDLGIFEPLQRKQELQRKAAFTRRLGLVDRRSDPASDGTAVDILKEARYRACGLTFDSQQRLVGDEVGDLDVRLADADAEHACASRVDFHPRAIEANIGVDRLDRWPSLCVGKRHRLRFRCDDELAALAVRERKFREVSGELHARIGCRPVRKRGPQPGAHVLVDRSRQVAVDLAGLHPRRLRRDVDFTRSPTIVFIRAGRIARRIRVGEVELLDPNGSPAVAALPLDDALQTVERNRCVEDPRQSQHRVVARKPELPVVVRQIEAPRKPCPTRERVLRDDTEVGEFRGRGIRRRRLRGALPAQATLRERAARREASEVVPNPFGNRQMRADGNEGRQLHVVEFDLTGRRTIRDGIAQRELEVRRVEPLAAERREGQVSVKSSLPLSLLRHPARPDKCARSSSGTPSAEPRLDVGELEVSDDLPRLTLRELEPDAERALAARDLAGERQPFAPSRDVGIVEPHEKRSFCMLPILDRVALEIAPNVDRCRELRGRCALESEPVAAEPILHAELDAVEDELRRIAQIVVPGDQRVANRDVMLAQDPVGNRGFVRDLRRGRWSMPATCKRLPGPVAADRESRPLDDELLEAELHQRQRCPRDDQLDLRQIDQRRRGGARALQHAKSLHDQFRVPPVPARRQRHDLDRMPELRRERQGQCIAIGLDVREHDKADKQEHERKRRESDDDDRSDKAEPSASETAVGARREARTEGIMNGCFPIVTGTPSPRFRTAPGNMHIDPPCRPPFDAALAYSRYATALLGAARLTARAARADVDAHSLDPADGRHCDMRRRAAIPRRWPRPCACCGAAFSSRR